MVIPANQNRERTLRCTAHITLYSATTCKPESANEKQGKLSPQGVSGGG